MKKRVIAAILIGGMALVACGCGGNGELSASTKQLTADVSATEQTVSISMVLHKTFIEVAAQGTKAGAATVVAVDETAMVMEDEPKTVYLDRPFVYLIVDMENNLPVFFGVVTSVEA